MIDALAVTLLMTACLAQAHDHAAAAPPASLMAGLGTHHHAITTKSPEAQRFFDQGLTLLYSFNHGRAIAMFQRAAELDPKSPMPPWGIALAYGPNINDFEMDRARAKTADEYAKKALSLTSPGNARERAYVEALAKRYSSDPAADLAKLQVDYKDAMAQLAKSYPNDLDAQVLYAESLMDLRPWQLWSRDGAPADVTPEIIRVLESVLARAPRHPGANHYYIHTMEGSPSPGKAFASARRLETLVPAAGHMVHMPAHIYARTGDFVASANSNAAAAAVDEKNMGSRTSPYALMYYNHNLHFESYAAAMAGQFVRANQLAKKLAMNVTPSLAEMPMLEAFMPQQFYVLLRFGKWTEVLAVGEPPDKLRLTAAIRHFARATAFAATGNLDQARAMRQAFLDDVAKIPAGTPVGVLNTAGQMFAVAKPLLDGRIAAAEGNLSAAVDQYRAAVAAEDLLVYDEPPTWFYPVRETLGAALLAGGHAADAEKVFRDDLAYNPKNGRSLFGLWKAIEAQGRRADAQRAAAAFRRVWAAADTQLTLSGF